MGPWTNSPMYYDKHGKAIGMDEFGRLHMDPEYKSVMKDRVGGWLISTVWLGLDHGFLETGLPVIFETMIFKPDEDGNTTLDDVYCRRYRTEDEAMDGHLEAMQWLIDYLSGNNPENSDA